MDDDRPLFTTFKPFGEDSRGRAKAAASTAPSQPQGAELPPGPHNRHSRVPPGFWSPPPAQSLPEGALWPERVALRARTRLWFEQTQAQRLGAEGELPAWFHGFISRREAEELLQDQPLGCFLVRFSESTIGFVLSYRGRGGCRHFVLDQLPDGSYVILGERSAHAELAELLRHHAAAPLPPYHEFLTVPLPCRWRDQPPRGRTQPAAGGDAAHSPLSEAPAKPPECSPVPLEPPRAQGGSAREAPSAPPSLPPKTSSRGGARGPRSPSGSAAAAAPEAPYAQVRKEDARPEPPEAKYQQLMCFHVYAEPREDAAPSPPEPSEPIPEEPSPEEPIPEEPIPEEPIPFYAMARGCRPRPEENIYSEVAVARQDPPARLPTAAPNAASTLPPKPRPHRRLFRSVSSQECRRRQLWAAPGTDRRDRGAASTGTEVTLSPAPELDGPTYSQSSRREQQTTENVYEQLPGDRP